MTKSNIEWTDDVWNPVTGCTAVSEGCRNCYAERMATKRLAGRCGYPADNPFKVTLHHKRLEEPLRWKKPRRVFVCSMGDLFHEDVPDEFIDEVFAVMALAENHTFMVLTKRPERMHSYMKAADWSDVANSITDLFIGRLDNSLYLPGEIVPPLPNIYLGVSVEDQKTADERIPLLLQTPAPKKFVSYEPTLGPVDFVGSLSALKYLGHIQGTNCGEWKCGYCGWYTIGPTIPKKCAHTGCSPKLDWIICGGESGPGARPMHPDWARSVRDQCQAAKVPFFFKQWGRVPIEPPMKMRGYQRSSKWPVGKKAVGALLDGREWKEFPE